MIGLCAGIIGAASIVIWATFGGGYRAALCAVLVAVPLLAGLVYLTADESCARGYCGYPMPRVLR